MLLARRCPRVGKLHSYILRRISSDVTPNGLVNLHHLPQFRGTPRFALPARCVRILETPTEFSSTLLVRVNNQRLSLCSHAL